MTSRPCRRSLTPGKHKPDSSAINHDHYRSDKGHEGEENLSVPATVEEGTHVGSPSEWFAF
jgi:hypothetical protein